MLRASFCTSFNSPKHNNFFSFKLSVLSLPQDLPTAEERKVLRETIDLDSQLGIRIQFLGRANPDVSSCLFDPALLSIFQFPTRMCQHARSTGHCSKIMVQADTENSYRTTGAIYVEISVVERVRGFWYLASVIRSMSHEILPYALQLWLNGARRPL